MEQSHFSEANRSSRRQKNPPHYIETEGSSSLSKQLPPPHDPYPETDQSSTHSLYHLLKIHFNSITL